MAADVPTEMALPAAPGAETFDLRDYTATQAANAKLLDGKPCAEATPADEIVVCAPDQTRFRLKREPARLDDRQLDATLHLSERLSLTPELEAAALAGGVQSNRAMVRLKFGF